MALLLSPQPENSPLLSPQPENSPPAVTIRWLYAELAPLRPKLKNRLPRGMIKKVKRWERFTDDPPIYEIDADTIGRFRENARKAGAVRLTVERTINSVITLLRIAHEQGLIFVAPPSDDEIRSEPQYKPLSVDELPKQAGDLTLRMVFANYFVPKRRNISPNTLKKISHELSRWERLTGNPPLKAIDADCFDGFRDNGKVAKLSNNTLESTIASMMQLLRFAHNEDLIEKFPKKGEPLRRYRQRGFVPSVQDLDLMYRAAETAIWPRFALGAGDFWRAWLCCAYFTGLRLADQMQKVYWSNLGEESLIVEANKTGKVHVFPVPYVLRQHLEPLRILKNEDDRIFPLPKSEHLVRRELNRMCQEAGIPHKIGPQALRRLAGTQWQRARWGAGQLLLGHSLGVSDFYIAPEMLKDALRTLEVPRAFSEPKENSLIGSENNPNSPIYKFARLTDMEKIIVSKLIDEVVHHVRQETDPKLRVYDDEAREGA